MEHHKQDEKQNKPISGWIGLLVIIVGILIYMEISGDKIAEEDRKTVDNDELLLCSQNMVKGQLKAPSTADFPWLYDDGVNIQALGGDQYKVSAYVDAQNSFGAMIRTKYYCDIQYPSNGHCSATCTLLDL